ncbi:MAG TPA: glycoside hydrolase family 5 protein, partial [Deinococcales bacterium]|nr:glycoside hydrolase family 5 protein [Deinococcales bacterium]
MTLPWLRADGRRVVDEHGQALPLRGTCAGGWLNMENFIDGYPGTERTLRAVVKDTLGPERAGFFFERFLHHFYGPGDAAFIAQAGATVVRVPFNYRHLENDAQPFTYLESGFAKLERAVELNANAGLYTILDLHAAPGWQNTDWHSDNATRQTLLWDHPHYQERTVRLWTAIAERFAGNPAVAGYNLLNEPVTNAPWGRFSFNYTPNWPVINDLYARLVRAIRAVDSRHILFLEGDLFSSRFYGLADPPDDNLVYSSHNYTPAGFGPGRYPGPYGGQEWTLESQREWFEAREGTRWTAERNVPLWVGEFGSAYNGPAEEVPDRLAAMRDQLSVLNAHGAHWTTWTYKDVGVMGWVTLGENNPYLERIAPILSAKRELGTDFWMGWLLPNDASRALDVLMRRAEALIPDQTLNPTATSLFLQQTALEGYLGHLMQPAYANRF